jgi:hypothetical protein
LLTKTFYLFFRRAFPLQTPRPTFTKLNLERAHYHLRARLRITCVPGVCERSTLLKRPE